MELLDAYGYVGTVRSMKLYRNQQLRIVRLLGNGTSTVTGRVKCVIDDMLGFETMEKSYIFIPFKKILEVSTL